MPSMRTHAALAQRLADRRAASGMSFNRVTQQVYDRLATFAPTLETVRTYHDPNRIPEQVNAVLVAALADVYDCTVLDLSETVNEDAKRARDLLIDRTGWLRQTLELAN